MHTNGLADKLLDQARERVAEGKATDSDKQMIVMEALSARGIMATRERREYKVRILGKELSVTDLIFIFGFLVAGESGYLVFEVLTK